MHAAEHVAIFFLALMEPSRVSPPMIRPRTRSSVLRKTLILDLFRSEEFGVVSVRYTRNAAFRVSVIRSCLGHTLASILSRFAPCILHIDEQGMHVCRNFELGFRWMYAVILVSVSWFCTKCYS